MPAPHPQSSLQGRCLSVRLNSKACDSLGCGRWQGGHCEPLRKGLIRLWEHGLWT